eukprot:8490871-Alexandrium_andersonii.AAC.1
MSERSWSLPSPDERAATDRRPASTIRSGNSSRPVSAQGTTSSGHQRGEGMPRGPESATRLPISTRGTPASMRTCRSSGQPRDSRSPRRRRNLSTKSL